MIYLFSFLAPNPIEASNCVTKNFRLQKSPTVKGAALNCSQAGSSWRGSLKTRQTRRGISLRWLDLINNPNCVDTISLYLDGELVRDQERPRPKQTKLEIKYAHTKCRSHSVILTVEVYIRGKEACYKASSRLTHHNTLNETQQKECFKKVEAEKDAKVKEIEKQRSDKLKSLEQKDTTDTLGKLPDRQDDIPEKVGEILQGEKVERNITEKTNNMTSQAGATKNTTERFPRTFQSLPKITMPKKPPNTTKRVQDIKPNINVQEAENSKRVADVENEKLDTENSLIFIGSMSFAGGLVVMMLLLVIVYLVRRRRRRGKFNVKQAVDLNFTYGTYSDYFSDYNTVEDTNDYYSSHI